MEMLEVGQADHFLRDALVHKGVWIVWIHDWEMGEQRMGFGEGKMSSTWMMSGTQPCAIDSYDRVENPMPEGARQNLEVWSTRRYSRGSSCLHPGPPTPVQFLPCTASPRRSRMKKPLVEL